MKKTPFSTSRSALLLAMLVLAFRTQDVLAQALPMTSGPSQSGLASARKGDETVQLEAFAITGSHIKRIDLEKVLPVTVLTRDLIDARNAPSPVELLTALPQVTTVPMNESSSGAAN